MSTSQQETLEDFIQLENRNAFAHAIGAAVELGIIGALRDGQHTARQLADELELDLAATGRLMDVLVSTELIEKYDDDYALSAIARLVPDRFFDFGDQYWQHLAKHIKTGTPLPTQDGIAATDLDYVVHKASQEWTLTPTAMSVAQALDLGKSRQGLGILEIGCGSAVFGITLLHSDPDSRLCLLDDELGIERARKTVGNVGLESQTTYVCVDSIDAPGAVTELDGQTFDLVLIVGQLHRRDLKECKTLFSQLKNCVKPGGELAVVDVFPGQKDGDVQRAIFELELELRTTQGKLHDPTALTESLKEAGFDQIQYTHLPVTPFYWGLLVAQNN